MSDKVHDKDVGTLIKLNTEVDLSGTSKVEVYARKPSGSVVTLSAETTETTKVLHTKTASTLTEEGEWKLQAHAEWPGGDEFHGEAAELSIYAALT